MPWLEDLIRNRQKYKLYSGIEMVQNQSKYSKLCKIMIQIIEKVDQADMENLLQANINAIQTKYIRTE